MSKRLDAYYLSYENCLILKSIGFDLWCKQMYGPYAHHNGEMLGSDEEFELRAEGKADEIEYKVVMQYFDSYNSQYAEGGMYCDPESCTCPELHQVVDWLAETHNIHFNVDPEIEISTGKLKWSSRIIRISNNQILKTMHGNLYVTKNNALESSIEIVLKELYEDDRKRQD